MTNRRYNIHIIWMISVLFAIFVVLYISPTLGQAQQPVVLVSHTEKGIHYSAAFDPIYQEINGSIHYDYMSPQGVQAYIEFNKQAYAALSAPSQQRPLYINIVFRRPLSLQEFQNFVSTYGLSVHRYRMRAVEIDGTRVTIDGAPMGKQLVPPTYLERVLQDIRTRNDAQFKGCIEVEATVQPEQLTRLQNAPEVFVIEAVYGLIYKALTPSKLQRAGATAETIRRIQEGEGWPLVQITHPSLYWALEDMGMVNKPTYSKE